MNAGRALAALALTTAALTVPTPAVAATGYDLTTGRTVSLSQAAAPRCIGLCLYNNNPPTGAGLLVAYGSSFPRSICDPLDTSITNRTVYVINVTGSKWFVFDGRACDTTSGPIYPNTSGAMGGQFYRSISSLYKY